MKLTDFLQKELSRSNMEAIIQEEEIEKIELMCHQWILLQKRNVE
jgi:hypothetical protein